MFSKEEAQQLREEFYREFRDFFKYS